MGLAADLLPLLAAVGWVVRAPLLSREEGHEAITRAACDGLALTAERRAALLRGVRSPDVSAFGLLTSILPAGQPRHALRRRSRTTTTDAIREMRDFMASRHLRALAVPDGKRRWTIVGEVLHCLQDSYSAAHADRRDGQIVRVRHWGLFRSGPDEHGFPTDVRDRVRRDGRLTDEAQAAVAASRGYLDLVLTGSPAGLAAFLDVVVPLPESVVRP